jgi:signal transduction histidine kinase
MESSAAVHSRPASAASVDFLSGGGELGALMRAYDWTKTPLGAPASWPQSLKTVVRIMLTSRQPFWVGYGPELTYLYNDPYKSIIGGRHPHALGKPFREVWPDIWSLIGPMADKVMQHDEGTYVEAMLLIMERNGYQEETYYTFSYSPVPGDDGRPGGLICANTDDTRRVIGERQVTLLRELAARTANARSWQEACALSAEALSTDDKDFPFALIYVDGALASAAGIDHERARSLPFDKFPQAGVFTLDASYGELPTGAWPRPPAQAAVLSTAASGDTGRAVVLVAGLNPFRKFDDSYRGFLELVVGQISASLANAQAYEEEKKRAESLARLDQAKTAFFSNVSHEFRTPLTLMLAPVDEILAQPEGGVLAENRALLEVVQRNGQRLLKLVNTLLDFARIEAGRTTASYAPTDLCALTADLASNFRSACERAGLVLEVDCPPAEEPAYVDREMWEKIVLNLVSNAFKFTLQGTIQVRLREVAGNFRLEVRDTGAGIPAEELPRVFERFYRSDDARGRSHEGSGIGLALAQELVKLHGGSIDVESEPGKGTTFTVCIPKGAAHLPAGRLKAAPGGVPTSVRAGAYVAEALGWLPGSEKTVESKKTGQWVLLADDNADLREYARRLLAENYEVEAVADGEAALAAARARRPDLIVSDVMMPRLDGFGLIRELRADVELRTVPVVLLSARAGEEARLEGLGKGADDYLVKPFSARELLVRVGALLHSADIRRQALEQASRAAEAKDEFLAMLSHELRNPLAGLTSAAHVLRVVPASSEEAAKARGVIERQTRHMSRLVGDLLDVSRVTFGKLELQRERFEAGEATANVVNGWRASERLTSHAVSLSIEAVWVEGDRARIEQIVTNLLENALKFTPAGKAVHIEMKREGRDAVLRVADQGIGLEADERARIFDLFVQGEHAEGGLGVGLALVKRLVEMHSGSVSVASEGRGRGSTFTVRLPGVEQPFAPVEAAPVAAVGGRSILIVEDNDDARQMLHEVLAIGGHQVRTAHDGKTGLAMATDAVPEVALIDVALPDIDGYEVARRIRAANGDKHICLVAVTGFGQAEDRRRALEAGFDAHLVKPVTAERLSQVIAELLSGARP